jgi:DsbC/DsbD-like thiol-disulfide interchange protein
MSPAEARELRETNIGEAVKKEADAAIADVDARVAAEASMKAVKDDILKQLNETKAYLHAYDSVSSAKIALKRYFGFYNGKRPHSALDGKTPDMAYFNQPLQFIAA